MWSLTFIAGLAIISEFLIPIEASVFREKRMVDGDESTIEDFPYLVALEWIGLFKCGGSILTPYHVVTAAHCFDDKEIPGEYRVRAGSSLMEYNGTLHQLRNYVIHENYTLDKYNNTWNDVALMVLEKPITFDGKSRMPIVTFEPGEEVKPGSIARAAGWGFSTLNGELSGKLQSISMKIVDKRNCSEAYRDIDGFHEGEICAVSLENRRTQSACRGDSGGPLLVDGKLAGIMAHVEDCDSLVYPNVFTEVGHFKNWIREKMVLLTAKLTLKKTQ